MYHVSCKHWIATSILWCDRAKAQGQACVKLEPPADPNQPYFKISGYRQKDTYCETCKRKYQMLEMKRLEEEAQQ